jgi:hypothetical protein
MQCQIDDLCNVYGMFLYQLNPKVKVITKLKNPFGYFSKRVFVF